MTKGYSHGVDEAVVVGKFKSLTLMPGCHMVPLAGVLRSVDLYLHLGSNLLVFLSVMSAASFLFFIFFS